VKQVLVLFAIIFVSVPLAKAEDDKWIDGIKFRYGEYNYPMSIGKKVRMKMMPFGKLQKEERMNLEKENGQKCFLL